MNRPTEILLVEDNVADIRLTEEALNEAPDPYTLLDLNMPRKGGREVPADVKGDPNPRRIPAVILTTSDDADDICNAYNLHADSYLVKPVDLGQFFAAIAALEGFWFSAATLPVE